jgi:hypothetical protein
MKTRKNSCEAQIGAIADVIPNQEVTPALFDDARPSCCRSAFSFSFVCYLPGYFAPITNSEAALAETVSRRDTLTRFALIVLWSPE